jgi:YbbR domain-containing protein
MAKRDWVTKDFSWKFASLIVAIVIWHIVHAGIREEPLAENPTIFSNSATFTNLPVLVVSAAADVRQFKVNPATVSVTVSGVQQFVEALTPDEIHPMVNLTDIEPGQNLSKRVDVSMPPGITLVSVDPAEVNVVVPPKKP